MGTPPQHSRAVPAPGRMTITSVAQTWLFIRSPLRSATVLSAVIERSSLDGPWVVDGHGGGAAPPRVAVTCLTSRTRTNSSGQGSYLGVISASSTPPKPTQGGE